MALLQQLLCEMNIGSTRQSVHVYAEAAHAHVHCCRSLAQQLCISHVGLLQLRYCNSISLAAGDAGTGMRDLCTSICRSVLQHLCSRLQCCAVRLESGAEQQLTRMELCGWNQPAHKGKLILLFCNYLQALAHVIYEPASRNA